MLMADCEGEGDDLPGSSVLESAKRDGEGEMGGIREMLRSSFRFTAEITHREGETVEECCDRLTENAIREYERIFPGRLTAEELSGGHPAQDPAVTTVGLAEANGLLRKDGKASHRRRSRSCEAESTKSAKKREEKGAKAEDELDDEAIAYLTARDAEAYAMVLGTVERAGQDMSKHLTTLEPTPGAEGTKLHDTVSRVESGSMKPPAGPQADGQAFPNGGHSRASGGSGGRTKSKAPAGPLNSADLWTKRTTEMWNSIAESLNASLSKGLVPPLNQHSFSPSTHSNPAASPPPPSSSSGSGSKCAVRETLSDRKALQDATSSGEDLKGCVRRGNLAGTIVSCHMRF